MSLLGALSYNLCIWIVVKGAATVCYVATHPDVKGISGKYFVDCNEAECSTLANDNEEANRLWAFSEKVTRLC